MGGHFQVVVARMSFNGRILLLSVIAVLLFPCIAQTQDVSKDEKNQAERVWDQMIAAKGGKERLLQVETMVQEFRSYLKFANPKFPNGEIHSVRAFHFPDREWDWIDSGKTVFGSQAITADLAAGSGYIGFPDGATRLRSDLGREKALLKEAQLVYLNETRWFQPKPVRLLRGKGIPHSVDAIETTLSDERIDFWISRTDHLPVTIIDYWHNEITHVLEPSYTYDFSDYHEAEGIKIPGTVAKTVLAGAPDKVRCYTILNPKLRDDLFTARPRFADGPDAWKAQ